MTFIVAHFERTRKGGRRGARHRVKRAGVRFAANVHFQHYLQCGEKYFRQNAFSVDTFSQMRDNIVGLRAGAGP